MRGEMEGLCEASGLGVADDQPGKVGDTTDPPSGLARDERDTLVVEDGGDLQPAAESLDVLAER